MLTTTGRNRWHRTGGAALALGLATLTLQAVAVAPVAAASGDISTLAGTGSSGYTGDGGPATAAMLSEPTSAVQDGAGNIYVADLGNHVVRKVDPSGTISTFAGNGTDGYSGDGGPATSAQMDQPFGLAVDAAGNVYIADQGSNNRIRKVDTSGTITTFAGNGSGSTSGDGGPAIDAGFNPQYMIVTAAGFFFTDYNNSNVRKIDSSGNISTFASGISHALGITGDPFGNLYVTANGNNQVDKLDAAGNVTVIAGNGSSGYSGDGGPATAAEFNGPYDVKYLGGFLYVADLNNNVIRRIDPAGTITTAAGSGSIGYLGDGGPATSADLNGPTGLGFDSSGNLLIAEIYNNIVRKVQTPVPADLLALSGSATPAPATVGQPVSYTLQVTNPGGAGTATNTVLTDHLPGNATYGSAVASQGSCSQSSGTLTCHLGTLGAGAAVNVTVTVTPTDPNKLTDTASVSADQADPFLADNAVTLLDGATTVDLAVSLDAPSNPVTLSVPYNYTATVTNNGPNPASGVTLTDPLPPSLTFDSASASQGTCSFSAGVVTCSLGALDAGANATVTITTTPTQSVTSLNVVSVAGDQFDPTPSNNSASIAVTAGCGETITQNTVLASDIGPCSGAGVLIGADHITLDLNGHHIFGAGNGTSFSNDQGSFAGVVLRQRTGVTVRNGTISGFDGGVEIISGVGNTITGMTLRDNVGHDSGSTRSDSGAGPEPISIGEGIFVASSPLNKIVGNTVVHNGPYDGIGVIGVDANSNTVQGNTVQNTIADSSNQGGVGIMINGVLFPSDPQLTISHNNVVGNKVSNNAGTGIALESDYSSVVKRNTVSGNGTGADPGAGIQIGFLPGFSATTQDTITANTVKGNGTDGIVVASRGNTITSNTSAGNNLLKGQWYDLHDTNVNPKNQPSCGNNTWSGNTWGSANFFPRCTSR